MLRIEKNDKVEIQFVKREPFFSKAMILALSIALFIHLTAWVFIQIKPLNRNSSDYIFPTIVVSATIDKPSIAVASTDVDGPSKKHIPSPQKSIPGSPVGPKINMDAYIDPFDLTHYIPIKLPDFDIAMESPKTIEDCSITVNLCGAAADLEILDNGISKEFTKNLPLGNQVVRFDVRIDPETGKVVWSHPLNDSSILTCANEILERLRTSKASKERFLISGEIEIIAHNQKL